MEVVSAERSAADVLRAARERISDPERWTQGVSPVAGRQSASDALLALPVGQPRERAWFVLTVVAERMGFLNIPDANDSGPPNVAHLRVLQMFDRAIELAEAEQS